LREKLLADGQVLAWSGPRREPPAELRTLPGVVVDDEQAEYVGEWAQSSSTPGFVGAGYHHDGGAGDAAKRAVFRLKAPRAGTYEVRMAYTAHENRAGQVRVEVAAGERAAEAKTVDQRKKPTVEGRWVSLGVVEVLAANLEVRVTLSNGGATGHVIADAVQLLPRGAGAR
jgi:hypothetical protein